MIERVHFDKRLVPAATEVPVLRDVIDVDE
jgi:hypothetical protein